MNAIGDAPSHKKYASIDGVATRMPADLRRRMKVLATQRDTSLYALTAIAIERFLRAEEALEQHETRDR